MKHIPKHLFLIITLFAVGCSNDNQDNNPKRVEDNYAAKIDSLIQTVVPRQFNGVVSITQYGKTIYSKAYGYSNFEEKIPISLKDNFRIQSNSKQITGVLILKEVEKGNIDLHSPIKQYLPDLQISWAETVTVHQLLNMSAGIVALDKPLLFKPGTNFHYSNPAYGLLGRIIEQVTGKEYTQVANSLFQELGMKNTYCYKMGKKNAGLINGYICSGEIFKLVEFDKLGFTKNSWKDFTPTGGIISNVTDLHIWDTKLHKGEILKAKYYKTMTNSNVPDLFAALSDEQMLYGYGIDICDKPIKYLGHGGTGFGFVSLKFYVPKKGLDVIVLENLYHHNIPINYHFEKEIRKIVLNSSLITG
ncbi:hypothetical protein BKI52_17305 [marine bacterium AO1-C]|nr:hypothetical protein BKI52_17305 [marine bacterium AO1-C]